MESGRTSIRARWRGVRSRIAPPVPAVLERAVGDAESILDVGCGERSPLQHFRVQRRTVGVDAHAPAVERSRGAGIHDDYAVGDALAIEERFGPRSFDAVVALDLLEHLEEGDGLRLIAAMERVARRRVVILTPNGFLPQDEYGGNPLQEHRSGWTAARLRGLGFHVEGVSGVRGLRGEQAAIRRRPERFWHLVSDLTQPAAGRFPRVAFQLVAVKEL